MSNTPVDYVEFWLKSAHEKIRINPQSDLYHFTSHNYSGGLSGWEWMVNNIYFNPTTTEEWFLSKEIHQVLLIAFDNVMKKADKLKPGKWFTWECMDISEGYRLALMIARADPLYVVPMKMKLNKLCLRFNESCEHLSDQKLTQFIGPVIIEW